MTCILRTISYGSVKPLQSLQIENVPPMASEIIAGRFQRSGGTFCSGIRPVFDENHARHDLKERGDWPKCQIIHSPRNRQRNHWSSFPPQPRMQRQSSWRLDIEGTVSTKNGSDSALKAHLDAVVEDPLQSKSAQAWAIRLEQFLTEVQQAIPARLHEQAFSSNCGTRTRWPPPAAAT